MMIKIKKILIIFFSIAFLLVASSIKVNNVEEKASPNKQLLSQATFTNPFFSTSISKTGVAEDIVNFSDIFNLIETHMNTSYPSTLARDTAIESALNTLVSTKRVGITTADDLYNFSVSASFNYRYTASVNRLPYEKTIKKILSYNYILLADIDYSTMKAKKFVPIGTDITIEDSGTTVYHYPFTGTFDGQGFVIKNLYLADYNTITTIHRFDDDPLTDIDIPLSPYYAMFNELDTSAVVKNFILENHVYELLNVPEGLINTAYLVGKNKGIIYNIAVIDKKTNQSGSDISGIRFNFLDLPSSEVEFTAAGFAHTNLASGKIYNSFFISKNVMSVGSKFRFIVKPFYYNNTGTIDGAAYDDIVVNAVDNLVQTNVNSYPSNSFITGINNGLAININNHSLSGEKHSWHFYPNDGIARLIGLEYDNTNHYFKINDEYDLIAFSKLINFTTTYNGTPYNQHNYRLINDIDMKNLPYYKTPSVEFKGQFSGGDVDFTPESVLNNNKYIMNLKLQVPRIIGSEYYLGFFSNVSGTVKNINFYNNEIIATKTADHYGKTVYIGVVSGKLSNGTVKNIISNTAINLGSEALGSSNVGGLIGFGSGTLRNLVNLGNINANTHDFNNLTTDGKFNIGGIIGASAGSGLSLRYAKNEGLIIGPSSNTNFTVKANDFIKISLGGIIGEVNNSNSTGNSLYYLTNTGLIRAGSFTGKNGANVFQNVGGIFGNVVGYGFKLVENDNTTIRNGRFENTGNIEATHLNDYTYYYTAGIGVLSTTEALAKVSYMTNSGNFNFTNFTSITHNKTIFYSATITDNSSGGIKLSRAYNEANFTFGSSYFVTATTTTKIAPFFTSITNNKSELVYVENKGSITVGTTTSQTDVNKELRVAGITLATKINYTNVYNSGDISLLRLNNTSEEIYVAGIAWILAYDTSTNTAYTATNILNKGNIITAGISGNTLASAPGSTNKYSFPSTFTSRNLYVAGLFNLNVGEITNSFNRGLITSNVSGLAANLNDITGTANSFVGGLVTINYHKMQDVGNTGDIIYTNINSGSTTYVADITYGSKYGGLIIAYKGGLALGGIVAAFGDTKASILSGFGQNATVTGEILDSANNGNIYGKAKEYVRSGGILAIALGIELTSGTDVNQETGAVKKFSYSVAGAGDEIIKCNLSNGLNFGNITAVTSSIGQYTGTMNTAGESSTSSNSERPGIFASAGGVIAYGLTKMQRMLNHGVVAATDVAGGIVGATYILGGTSQAQQAITYVNINTAVHYGKIKAIRTAKYNDVTYSAMENIYTNNISDTVILYPDNDTSFIFQGSYNLSIYPNRKRGFGGIFGRLQRGSYGSMRSNNFINILNMDPNIDMVGRVDQSSYGSLIYFLFKVTGVNDTYYTARTNDTTQATLVGYNTAVAVTFTEATKVTYQITRSGSNPNYTYTVTNVAVTSGSGYYHGTTRYVGVYSTNASVTTGTSVTETRSTGRGSFNTFTNTFTSLPSTALSYYNLTPANVSGLSYSSNRATLDNPSLVSYFYNNITLSYSPAISHALAQYPIERVSDDQTETMKTYIFDSNFPLMNQTQSNYIYNAQNDALASRFQSGTSNKPNGMYVLASTKGRQAGAVLPGNIKIDKLYSINESLGEYLDVTNIPYSKLITTGTDVEAFENDFKKMFQVSYNEKSLVLNQTNQPTLADLILYDPSGNSPTLQGGVINDANKTITFTVSNDAFSSSNVNYQVLQASLSEKAVIAKSGVTVAEHSDFRQAYNQKTSNILGGAFLASFSGTINSGQTVTLATKLTVYSEIAAQVSSLISKYKTEYSIIITRQATSLNISLANVYVNNSSATVPSLVGNKYTVTSHKVSASGSIEADFLSGSGLLPLNHNITIDGLYYGANQSDLVENTYYSLSLTPVGTNNHFGFKVNLDSRLKEGTYAVKYRIYANTSEYYLVFTKDKSSEYSILGVDYFSYSSDSLGEVTTLTPQTNDFNTYIGFGEILDGILYNTNNPNITINKVVDLNTVSYLDNALYYEIIYDSSVILKITLSPFANLSSLTTKYLYNVGIKEYEFKYVITDENGSPHNITHTIIERNLPDFIVYKNGNNEDPNYIEVYREEQLAEIIIDFGFPYASLNENVITSMYKNSQLYIPQESDVYFTSYTYYEINITYLLEVGLKEYYFELERASGVYLSLGSINIEKLLGIDAYLKDIRFQVESEQIVMYPNIYVASSNGTPIVSPHYPMFYYDGIDYDNANTVSPAIKYFKIDGKVSDIDLEYYHPLFYLPIGASIERKKQDNSWTTDLFADYIGYDEDQVVIEYRVTSENGQNQVHYFLTAEDISYNLTIRFTIFFQKADGTIYEAKHNNSLIKNDVVLINIKNYKLKDKDEFDQPIEYLPTIDVNGKHHYPFEDVGIKNYVVSLNTQATLFYFPSIYPNYLYTFGRNLTGAYGFSVLTPVYNGTTTANLVHGKRYTYSIYLRTGAEGSGDYPWYNDNYLLPNFDEDNFYTGKYFYIVGSPRQIIREFAILVHEETFGQSWGLNDDYATWDQN